MVTTKNLWEAKNEIKAVLHEFYLEMQHGNVEAVYDMLSPNLRQLTAMDEHSEKYQRAFKFGRKMCWTKLYSLTEIKPFLLEGVVMLCLLSEDAKPLPGTQKHQEADQVYCAFKVQFISLNGFWWVDDICIYEEFWSNEYKNKILKEQAQLN